MPKKTLLYFVNNDGTGHWQRAQSILKHVNISTLVVAEGKPQHITLPQQHTFKPIPAIRNGADNRLGDDCLHIPYGKRQSYLSRLKAMIDIAEHYHCQYAVIDVCAEVAMTMRLAGIPYLFMRMNGNRNDAAHLQAYKAADALLATYPKILEEKNIPEWVKQKTIYTGGIINIESTTSITVVKPIILIVKPKGKNSFTADHIKHLAAHIKNYEWQGVGFDRHEQGDNFRISTFIENLSFYIQMATIVITSTGNNSVLEAAYFQKPLITLPEPRFFDEQIAKAAILAEKNLAVVLEEWTTDITVWNSLLNKALNLNPWGNIVSRESGKKAATAILRRFTETNR
jgi:hypothetical protein